MTQGIRFCTSADGTRLAFLVDGAGPPLLIVIGTDSDGDLDKPGICSRHWRDVLTRHVTRIRFDARGIGMSQRDPLHVDSQRLQEDIDAVSQAAGFERFNLMGLSGTAAVAVRYAASRPERVERLIIHGGFARGRLRRDSSEQERRELQVLLGMLAVGYGVRDEYGTMFRHAIYKQHFPSQPPEFFAELERGVFERIPQAANAAYPPMQFNEDLTAIAPLVRCPTLVMHARFDRHTPLDEGARLAALIPEAQFVITESENHFPLADEPAWRQVTEHLFGFLGVGAEAAGQLRLTQRQLEVLRLIAAGHTDKETARALSLSPRTVEMHVAAAMRSLGCATRAEAVARASAAGWLG